MKDLRRSRFSRPLVAACAVTTAIATLFSGNAFAQTNPVETPALLSDPFLQLPGDRQVNIVWFTEEPGA